MKKLIIGNWKMNPKTPRDARRLADAVGRGVKNIKNIQVVLTPPFIYLPFITNHSSLKLAAQDVYWQKSGAYTGEISIHQLKAFGVTYVIVGHSERRAMGETDEIVHKKLEAVLGAGTKAVLCIGEPERKKDEAFPAIVRKELHSAISKIKKPLLKNLIIAYEPIWAVGTGNADDSKAIYEMAILIKRDLQKMLGSKIADKIPVLYGGSVKASNAKIFLKDAGVDGLLVGGASLDAKQFVKIIKDASQL